MSHAVEQLPAMPPTSNTQQPMSWLYDGWDEFEDIFGPFEAGLPSKRSYSRLLRHYGYTEPKCIDARTIAWYHNAIRALRKNEHCCGMPVHIASGGYRSALMQDVRLLGEASSAVTTC
ncbi:unnamed protein product [Zymoseptoria tritici ST99CH_3D1]|nr:unnamed protein product [Zymoseptoria tritici ST99CH_1E4]SMR50370.1 unnamed protein product [Zymoseptoria tritici ST99CH_3D1]